MLEPIYRETGCRISAARKRAKMSQEALAKSAGLKRETLSRIENGRFRVQLHTLVDLAGALGLQPAALVKGA
jgi:transcriptional regulator with XRE-family HTH domain